MRLRTLFALVAISVAALVAGLSYWRKTEATAARRLEAWEDQQRIDATAAVLEQPLEWTRRTVALTEFTEILAENSGLAVEVDRIALEAEGRELPNIRVDIPGGTLPLGSVLRLGLAPHELCYDTGDRRLTITTPSVSRDRTRLRTVVYPLPQPEMASAEVDEENWQELVTTLVEPDGWTNAGGPGHCETVPGTLVIVQTEHAHRQIRGLLESLARLQSPPQSLAPVPLDPFLSSALRGRRIFAPLNEPTTIVCRSMPLDELLTYLSQRHQLPIAIDSKGLQDAGVAIDMPITAQLPEVSLRSALRHVLQQQELELAIREGTVLVTTGEVAEAPESMLPIAYPVHDLVATPAGHDYDPLIDLISTTVAPETWGDVGGPALIGTQFNGWLVISQTWDVHQQIEQLLAQVRRALAYDEHPTVMGIAEERPTERRIRAALDRKIALNFQNTPLREAANQIGEKLKIPIHVSAAKLAEVGVNVEAPLTSDLPAAPLRNQLRELLAPLDLTFVVQNEVLLITTPSDAASPQNSPVRIYDVRPLTDPDLGVFGEEGLESVVTGLLAQGSWANLGGPGSLQNFRGLAVVSQIDEIHGQTKRLLAAIEQHCLPARSDNPARPWIVNLDSDPATERIEELLNRPVKVEFHGKTIHQAVTHVAEQVQVPVVIDIDSLRETLVPTLPSAIISNPDLTLAGILERILRPSGFAYSVADQRLVVSFVEAIDRRHDTRLYRVDDLAQRPDGNIGNIIEQIVAQTDPQAWDGRLGTGRIRPVGQGWFGVTASSRWHERVADVLIEMRTGTIPPRERERRELAAEMAALNELKNQRAAVEFLKREKLETNPSPTDPNLPESSADPLAP